MDSREYKPYKATETEAAEWPNTAYPRAERTETAEGSMNNASKKSKNRKITSRTAAEMHASSSSVFNMASLQTLSQIRGHAVFKWNAKLYTAFAWENTTAFKPVKLQQIYPRCAMETLHENSHRPFVACYWFIFVAIKLTLSRKGETDVNDECYYDRIWLDLLIHLSIHLFL